MAGLLAASFLLLAAAQPVFAQPSAASIQGIRVHNAPHYTRLVIDADEELEYRLGGRGTKQFINLNNLDNSNSSKSQDLRTTFDLDNVNLAGSRIAELLLEHGRGARAKLRITTHATLRVEAFRLAPVPPYGHRLVIDLFDDLAGTAKRQTVRQSAPAKHRAVVVAIDPGHGGEDPGALGAGGVREAHVVLTLARKVANNLRSEAGLRVVLVRDGDYYVRRRQRMSIARTERADLFVSLHADAFNEASVQGASVYALSSGGASSEAASWLAAKDSRSDLIGGVASDVNLKQTDATLAKVLLDLSMDAQRNSSLRLADALLAELGQSVELHKYTVEQASFVVLKSPDIPSVLVETGFLSNPEEARRLSDPRYQDQVANAVARGIVRYIERHPPPGSLIAQRMSRLPAGQRNRETSIGRAGPGKKSGQRRHIIQPGDSLSEVAVMYGISTKALRAANALASDRIKIGQVLTIPLP